MGFDFTSETGTTEQIRGGGWSLLLYAAESYGWLKLGTLPPEGVKPEEWEGDYATNDGQSVRASDAVALAEAWERLLLDPQRVLKVRALQVQMDEDLRRLAKEQYGVDLPPEPDGGEYPIDEEYLRTLIQFCRLGGFRID